VCIGFFKLGEWSYEYAYNRGVKDDRQQIFEDEIKYNLGQYPRRMNDDYIWFRQMLPMIEIEWVKHYEVDAYKNYYLIKEKGDK